MFADPSVRCRAPSRDRLKNPDHVAVTISTDQVHGVAGFLVPGDEVNMMVKFDNVNAAGEAAASGSALNSSMRYLYQKVQILAVGQSTLLAPGEQTAADTTAAATAGSGLITFNVPPEAAQWIASAQEGGGIYMTLVADDYQPRPLPPVDTGAAELPGESGQLTPYGPQGNQD